MVKTTVFLEDPLFKRVKSFAVEHRRTLKDTVAELLERGLKATVEKPAKKFVWHTFKGGSPAVPVEDRDALYDFFDRTEDHR